MDWITRKVLAWRLSSTMDAEFFIAALKDALARFGRPGIFNTDQGSQGGFHDRAALGGGEDQHGRPGPLDGQCLYRVVVAAAEIRVRVPERLRDRLRAILLWLLVAIVIGVTIGRLAGFIMGEFVMRPVLLLARGIAALLGAVAGWARRLP